MKIIAFVISAMFFAVQQLCCQDPGSCVTDVLLSSYSERMYTTTPVTDQQLDIILRCGVKTPSAVNRQPWRFTVIRDSVTVREAIKDAVAGNVLIIISGTDSQSGNGPNLFDCGLATQNMFVAAHGLGLGARIYGSPAGNVNSKKDMFAIPAGYQAVMILRIGNVDRQVDAVSAASPRKTFNEVVNYK